jgi:hypothetical protein
MSVGYCSEAQIVKLFAVLPKISAISVCPSVLYSMLNVQGSAACF